MSKEKRRLFRQRALEFKKRYETHRHFINNDRIEDAIRIGLEFYKHYESSPYCSSIIDVRTKLRLGKRNKLKNHWFITDTVKAIYAKSGYQGKPKEKQKPLLVLFKKLVNGLRLLKFTRHKVYFVKSNSKLSLLRCNIFKRVYIRPTLDNAIVENIKAVA